MSNKQNGWKTNGVGVPLLYIAIFLMKDKWDKTNSGTNSNG